MGKRSLRDLFTLRLIATAKRAARGVRALRKRLRTFGSFRHSEGGRRSRTLPPSRSD